MKRGVHPGYYNTKIVCVCGNVIETRATVKDTVHVEICSNCHPFFTGKQRLIDSAGQIEKYTRKWGKKKEAPAAAAAAPSTPSKA